MKQGEFLQCWLLHGRPYRDSSLLLEFFTREEGRVGAVARGVRSVRSGNRRSLLQPFTPLQIVLSGRGELRTLSQVEPLGVAMPLAGERLLSGLYLNELLIRLLPQHEREESLYNEYDRLLRQLATAADLEVVLRGFELSLLECLGYGLQFERDMLSGEPIQPNFLYRLHEEGGFVLQQREFEQDLIRGEALLAIAARDFSATATRRAAKLLLRQALQQHLGGRDIQSRNLFRRTGKLPPPDGPG